jgi:ribosomal protein S6--L-glutamate ligase
MQLLVLGSPQSWYLADLKRAARGRHRVETATFKDLQAASGMRVGWTSRSVQSAAAKKDEAEASSYIDLQSFDSLLVRTMPPGSLEQVVFRMDVLARLEAAGMLVVNPARAIETAVDKYLATARMETAGLRVPRTIVCQTPEDALQAFADLGGDVVLKPLFGAEGRGIARLNDEAMALRAFKLLADLRAVIYLQEFIQHEGSDIRVLLIGDIPLAKRRRNPLDWRTNVSRGAVGEPCQPTDEMLDMARRAAAAIGAPLAGVDLLPGRDGKLYAIEVNAVPGWRELARVLNVDVAGLVLEYLAERL